MSRIFYTADLHLGDSSHNEWNIKDGIPEHFDDHFHYYDVLMKRWNYTVAENDIVYIVGDVFSRNAEIEPTLVSQLNGEKHLIIGNHDEDSGWIYDSDMLGQMGIVFADEYLVIEDKGREVVLFHYPISCWNRQWAGAYHIYGHVHAAPEETIFQHQTEDYSVFYPEFRALNAGAMLWEYTPTTLDEMCLHYRIGEISDEEFRKREKLTRRFESGIASEGSRFSI